jgi:glycosyltransferase involved in cell wall biosynthesis
MAGGHTRERTALIVTVLNEADTIDDLLASVVGQTCQPDEVVIVDGGSRDLTLERIDAWSDRLPLRVISAPGANIARGRNVAIHATTCEVVAVTDAGVRLDPRWLELLRKPLTEQVSVDVVSGFFLPDARTLFERAMGATVLPSRADVRADSFLPSSRSVLFRKKAWARVGGYPEWLDYCEDLVFDLGLRRAGSRFAFEPRAVVHFRPRGSVRGFFRQYFRYARGDGKADLWRRRHAARYTTYATLVVLLRAGPWGWLVALVGGLIYCRRPWARLPRRELPAVALVPVLRLVGDVAKMLGYPVGVWWRWTCRSSS